MADLFADILNTPSSEIERPKPLPAGSYVCVVAGLPEFDKSTKKETPYAKFTLRPIAAGDDIDAEDLEAAGGLEGKTIQATYYLTEASLWRLKKFIQDCGVDVEDDRTLGQQIEDVPNQTVIAYIKHRPSADGESMFAELANTAPAE